MGASISSAFGDEEYDVRQDRIARMWDALDADGSGEVSRAEVLEWIQDERFVGNSTFAHDSLREAVERMAERLDRDQDGSVSREELTAYLDGVPVEMIDDMTMSLRRSEDEQRDEVLRRVYEALDTDGDGKVSKDEVLFWLRSEKAWKEQLEGGMEGNKHEAAREMIYRMFDRDASGDVSFDELRRFFATWKVRELRKFTSDQLYYSAMSEVAANPDDEDAKRRLEDMKRDRSYDRVSRREARRAQRSRRRGNAAGPPA